MILKPIGFRPQLNVEISYNPYQGLKHFNSHSQGRMFQCLVEISYNPYQGLKHQWRSMGRLLCRQVEISYNPYQGLKLSILGAGAIAQVVEISYNPYQGLKHAQNTSKN
ncbi:conserved hypothetical protein [Planktothrix serta PCC 8927]|uniref:Uncharacterized protein n=1 Tax=Planktothrix serta PCC 8927 TaxID=671068 RepID=A0A7Z9BZD8_9CYAN|nr:conserved hypothetical protein [Planktothrix serta PCC 8927]